MYHKIPTSLRCLDQNNQNQRDLSSITSPLGNSSIDLPSFSFHSLSLTCVKFLRFLYLFGKVFFSRRLFIFFSPIHFNVTMLTPYKYYYDRKTR